jgi:hypothetical protein
MIWSKSALVALVLGLIVLLSVQQGCSVTQPQVEAQPSEQATPGPVELRDVITDARAHARSVSRRDLILLRLRRFIYEFRRSGLPDALAHLDCFRPSCTIRPNVLPSKICPARVAGAY